MDTPEKAPAPRRPYAAVGAAVALAVLAGAGLLLSRPGPDAERAAEREAAEDVARGVEEVALPGGAAPRASGLDLLRRPDGAAPGDSLPPAPADAPARARDLQRSAAGMLDSLAPMLDDPAMTRRMTPEQKAEMKELRAAVDDLRAQIAAGRSLSDAEFAKRMERLQRLTMKMMSAGAGVAPPGTGR